MRNRQRGITAVGWLVLLTPLVIVIYAGVRMAPVYLNYMKVLRAIDNAANSAGGATDATSIRTAIDRHFEIDMVDFPTAKDIMIKREGGSWVIEAKYDDEAPLFGNVSLHVAFDKIVRTGGSAGD